MTFIFFGGGVISFRNSSIWRPSLSHHQKCILLDLNYLFTLSCIISHLSKRWRQLDNVRGPFMSGPDKQWIWLFNWTYVAMLHYSIHFLNCIQQFIISEYLSVWKKYQNLSIKNNKWYYYCIISCMHCA